MNVEEILNGICGRNPETHEAKAITGVYLYEAVIGEEHVKEINSAVTYNPEVQIYPLGQFTTVEINFSVDSDVDLYKICQMLKKRLELSKDNPDKVYAITCTFMPKDYSNNKSFSIECMNPLIHSLTALTPQGKVSCLRIVFDNEDVNLYEQTEVDTYKTDIEVNYSLDSKYQTNKMVEEKRKAQYEHERYMNEIAKKKNY